MHPSRPTWLVPVTIATVAACGAPKPPPAVPPPAPSPAPVVTAAPFEPPAATTTSTRATLKLRSTWAKCHQAFSVGSGDARAEVARLAATCAGATSMHRVGEPFAGDQAASARPQSFRWKAQAGRCYRVYGAGVPAIKNLDLLVLDSAGVVLGQDGNDDGAPVVLDAGAVCFKQDDEAVVVVSVGDGAGAFAVEVWSD